MRLACGTALLCSLISQGSLTAQMTDSITPDQAAPRFLTMQTPIAHADPMYLFRLQQWRAQHAEQVMQPDGWLSLVALEPLPQGTSSIGSAPGNTIRLEQAPPYLAVLERTGETVRLAPPTGGFPPGVSLNYGPPGPAELSFDPHHPSELRIGSLLLLLIQRGDRLYLRVKDSASPALRHRQDLRWYAPDPQMRITARWVPAGMAGDLAIPNLQGQITHEPSPGMAEFTLYGQIVRLFPVVDGPHLFFPFRDATANTSTSRVGRYLYTDLPSNGIAREGTVMLDFNRAENPPCAYNPFVTCPLPPQINRLTIPVPAGEQRYPE